MKYKGYSAEVEFDGEQEVLHGRVVDLNDVITFEATSVEGLRAAFQGSVDDYLEWCRKDGREPERPFSGRILLRLDPQLHRAATCAASRAGVSLNEWLVEAVRARGLDRSSA